MHAVGEVRDTPACSHRDWLALHRCREDEGCHYLQTHKCLARLVIDGTNASWFTAGARGANNLLRCLCVMMVVWLAGCGAENFNRPGDGGNETLYTALYPYYAEFCAVSQIDKKVGFGADIRGQPGGHSVFYLNGACRDSGTAYPVLRLCDPSERAGDESARSDDGRLDGVGLSMNAHFSNAKWVAVPGRAFFFDGGLPPNHGLTRADYLRAKATAKQLGIYRAIKFHKEVFDDKPADVSEEDWKYEVSIATDYAISFGRGRFCARVPVDRTQMERMIAFLNAQNAPYREGKATFEWSVFQDNCIHLAHNALAAAGVWPEWPIDMPLLFAIFDFPVPKNDFVNLVLRVNDPPDLDLLAIYHDPTAARSLAEFDRLPWQPGAVVESRPPQTPNDVYDTNLGMLFYDDPITGRYQARLDQIFSHPRYFDIEQNLRYFAALFHRLGAERRPLSTWLAREEFRDPEARQRFTDFYRQFYAFVAKEDVTIEARLARLTTMTRDNIRLRPLDQAAAR